MYSWIWAATPIAAFHSGLQLEGTKVGRGTVDEYVGRSLMLVTALSPDIDYNKASAIAHKARRRLRGYRS